MDLRLGWKVFPCAAALLYLLFIFLDTTYNNRYLILPKLWSSIISQQYSSSYLDILSSGESGGLISITSSRQSTPFSYIIKSSSFSSTASSFSDIILSSNFPRKLPLSFSSFKSSSSLYHSHLCSGNTTYCGSFNSPVADSSSHFFFETNKKRIDLVQDICEEFVGVEQEGVLEVVRQHVIKRKPTNHMFTVYPDKGLAWCRTPKVGTTTWAKIFLQLYGVSNFHNYHSQVKRMERRNVRKKKKAEIIRTLRKPEENTTLGMMIVRHPVDRLASAYRDKIARKRIVLKGFNSRGRRPSFGDFLSYIASKPMTQHDRHWKPMWLLCNPCLYRYNYLLKMETFSQDSVSVLTEINALNLTEIDQLNGGAHVTKNSLNYTHLLREVEPSVLHKILHIYYLDFLLFGYDIKPIYQILENKQQALESEH